MPWIIEHGGAAYAALGPEGSQGTRLFSLSGHLARPGNYEIVMGMTWRELIYEVGGGMREGRTLKAWIPGGASAPWFVDEHLDLPVTIDDCNDAGSMLGSGAVVVMDDTTCMVRAAERVVRFFAHESCGQCTQCREGSSWMHKIATRIAGGAGRTHDLDLLVEVASSMGMMPGLSICGLADGAAYPIRTIVEKFRQEFEERLARQDPEQVRQVLASFN